MAERIDTEEELRSWISSEQNREKIQVVHGVGPKTADYLGILVGIQTAAVDRYVYRLLEEAGLGRMNYEEASELLNLAADSLEVERTKFDHSIWKYMSQREKAEQGHVLIDQGSDPEA